MKLIILLLITASAFANAAAKLNPKIGPDGKAQLGIQYSYGQDDIWIINYTSDLSVKQSPPAIEWNLLNVKTNLYLQEWTPATRDALIEGRLAVTELKPLYQLLVEMKSYQLVFADQARNPLYYFDIGELCASYPTYIADLTNTMNKPCEVTKEQLPDEASCADQEKYFAGLLQKGLITCTVANHQLDKIGCQPLNCK